MSADDERLRLLRSHAREWAVELRPHALETDTDPDVVSRIAGLEPLSALQIPPEFGGRPLVVGGERFHLTSAVERAVFFEEGAWGDLGLVLAAPGSLLAGSLVAQLGDNAQQEWFYGTLLERPMWTFLAMTEPEHGSDATALRTSMVEQPDGHYLLSGTKKFVGNAARAGLGVVVARTAPGPLGLCSAIVDTTDPGFSAEHIHTIGLNGVLGCMWFDSVRVPADRMLGRHLSATRRGVWGWTRSFNVLRAVVAAMGVGVAVAAYEYVLDNRSALSGHERDVLDRIATRIDAVRGLTHRAAAAVDADPGDGHLASAAKVAATRLAEETTLSALGFFGYGARIEHPLLDKWSRDARGVECMEGTTNIQRLAVAGALLRGGVE